MRPTDDQSRTLAELEQTHGRIKRVEDGSALAEYVLRHCVTGTRVFWCASCDLIFAIEPDGDIEVFARLPAEVENE